VRNSLVVYGQTFESYAGTPLYCIHSNVPSITRHY
jgi:hypothetical protein